MEHIEVGVEISELPEEAQITLLGGMLWNFDAELGREVGAMLRIWADQTDTYHRDGSINPRGKRTGADYRRLADAIDEHAAYLRDRTD